MSAAPRRIRRWFVVIGLVLVLLMGTAFAVLRVKFEGEDLGDYVATSLNKRMRGRIEIGSIEWPASGIKTAITGGWVPLTLRDVKVWDDCALNVEAAAIDEIRTGDPSADCTLDDRPDPDPKSRRKPRKLLLRTAEVTAEIDVHAAMFGNHDLVFRNVHVHGGEALLEQAREPYPLHAYDRTIVSIITAFYPRMKAGFRAGIYADSAPPIFDVRDVHIHGLNLTVHMGPYSAGKNDRVGYAMTGRLEGVDVDPEPDPAKRKNDSYLYMDATDPLVAKFYVRLGVTAKRGTIRIRDEGPRSAFRLPYAAGGTVQEEAFPPEGRKPEYQVALTDIKLNRLAQMPGEWARKDFVANTLELDLEARTLPCPTTYDASPDPAKGASLHLTGELHNYWDRPYDGSWNLLLDAKNVGPTIRSCIDDSVGGDALDGTVTLTGPFVASPKVGLAFKNLDVDVPLGAKEEPLRLTLAELQASIDLVNEQGSVDRTTALIRGGKEPGEVVVSATFGLKPYNARAHVEIAKAIDVGRFLPDPIPKSVGRYLQGRLTAVGNKREGFALEDFDLALGATEKERAIRAHKGRLFTDDEFGSIKIQKVHVDAGRSRAIFDGVVDIANDSIDVEIDGNFPDLDVWLKRFGLPQFVSSAGGGKIRITGPLSKPKIAVATELGGVPCLDKVRIVDATYEGNTIDVRSLTSAGLGGKLTGNARVRLGEGAPVIERLHLDGKQLDATKLCGLKGIVKGNLDSLEVDLAGTVEKNRSALEWLDLAEVHARASKLEVMDEKLSNVQLCLNRRDDARCRPRATYLDKDDLAQCEQGKRERKRGGSCAVATATRDKGGILDATIAKLPATRSGKTTLPARLGGTVAVSDFPLGIIDTYVKPGTAGGLASIKLHLAGPPTSPQASGVLQLMRTWAASSFLGDADLAIEPTTITRGSAKLPALSIRGKALAGRLAVSGTIGTAAPYPVELSLSGRRIELDVLLDLQKRLPLPAPVQAWASGTITIRTELAPAKPVEPEAWLELTELTAIVNHRSVDGRILPLVLKATCRTDANDNCAFEGDELERTRMSVLVTPSSIEFACKDPTAKAGRVACGAKLATPAGIVNLRGYARPNGMAIEAKGSLDLSLLAPLFDTYFDEVTGAADLAASITGTFKKPTYDASLALRNVVARPVGGDTVLTAPTGLIKLANGSLGFTDVRIQVRDQHRDQNPGELHIKGNIGLDGLKPKTWGLLIEGKLAGKMLLAAFPGSVSQASGLARIEGDLLLRGSGPLPTITGTLVFDPLPECEAPDPQADRSAPVVECRKPTDRIRPFTIIPRGVRREFAFSRGTVDIETVVGSGDRRTYRLSVNDVALTVDGQGSITDIDGNAEIRDGALIGLSVGLNANNIPFRLPGTLDLAMDATNIRIEKASEISRPIVRGNIKVTDGSYQRNFEITDRIRSIGTTTLPSKPFWEEYPSIGNADLRLGLDVRRFKVNNNIAQIDLSGALVISGTPRDPRLRGRIGVTRGRFRFPGTRAAFERTNGSIDFAENDRAGNPELNVSTDADYRDQSGQDHLITLQIRGKLDQLQWDLKTSTGYNKSQTLALLVLGRNPDSLRRSLGDQSLGGDPTRVDPSTNPSQGFADQIVKDLAGDWVSGLLGSSLGRITGLDVFRIEIGFGSIGIHVEEKVLDNVRLLGDTEQTIRGSTINARAEIKTTIPWLSAQAGYLSKNFNDPAEQDIQDANAKLVFRLFIP